jgi:hypothetical protein
LLGGKRTIDEERMTKKQKLKTDKLRKVRVGRESTGSRDWETLAL